MCTDRCNRYWHHGIVANVHKHTDVTRLRMRHRITGSLIGSLPTQPKQNNEFGLPLVLQPEETTLLVEQGVLLEPVAGNHDYGYHSNDYYCQNVFLVIHMVNFILRCFGIEKIHLSLSNIELYCNRIVKSCFLSRTFTRKGSSII